MFSHAIKHINDSGTGGKPYDAEVEYIESTTDGQYIDTGITFDRLYDFEVEVNCCPVIATRSIVCGTYSGSGTSFNLEFGGSDNGIERQPRGYIEIGGGALDKRASAVSLNVLSTISLSYTASNRLLTLKSGNETITGTVASGSGTSSNTLWLFNDHRQGGMNRQVRISGIKVKKNGTVVRDLVAVRVGTEYCLYDKANPTGGDNGDGLYHNKGTGAFLGGVDKPSAGTKFLVSRTMGSATGTIKPVLKHYDIATSYTIHEGNGNSATTVSANFPSDKYTALDYTPVWEHHRFAGWTTKPPYDAEIEYLESTGTQFIKTGITQADDLTIECTFQKTGSTSTWGTYFGCGYSDNSAYNILGRHYSTTPTDFNPWFANTTYGECRVPVSTNSMNTVVVKAGSCVKDGTSYTISTVTGRLSSYEIYLFTANKDNASWRPQPCRISRFVIKRGSTTLADYIPVRVGTVGCMYDKVSGEILSNAGTGDFVKGSDTKVVSGNSISPSDGIIYDIKDIYATWQLPTTVTFDATTNGGQMPSGWTAPDYYEGQPYGTLPTPTHATFNFIGWYINGSKVNATDLVQENATLVAQYSANSYSVDISNGDWELENPNTNPDTNTYDGVYRNSRYWNSPPGQYADKLYINVVGYTSFMVYIRSNAEVNYSYTVAVKADYDPTSFNDAISNKQGATTANNTSTAISGYTAVTYTLDGGSHTICIVYGHKDNIKQNDDRGYLLIPKQQ